jgi:hypothetical protein
MYLIELIARENTCDGVGVVGSCRESEWRPDGGEMVAELARERGRERETVFSSVLEKQICFFD